MRRHVIFLSAIFLLIGSILIFSLALRDPRLLDAVGEKKVFQDFLHRFQTSHRPRVEINLSALYGGGGQFQLLHPSLAMKSTGLKLPDALCSPWDQESNSTGRVLNRHERVRTSDGIDSVESNDLESAKREDYIRIVGSSIAFQEEFLFRTPFVDKSGWSYAYLLAHKGIAPFDQASWLREHLSFFKPTELKEIMERHRIEHRAFETIAQLTESEIKALAEGAPLVLSANVLLVKNQPRLGFSPLSYLAYDVRDLRTELKDLAYDLVPAKAETLCLEKIGNACWTYNSQTILASVSRYAVAVLIAATMVLLVLCALYLKHVIDDNERQKKHRTSLQVLTHEFRTPVSVMLMLLDQMTRTMSRMEESDQDLLTKLSAEAFRLQRIIEMSKTYLQSNTKAHRFKRATITSMNGWIEDFALDQDPRIRCELLQRDQSIVADPFWLRFVLTNLIQNAFAHGREPVLIRLSESKRGVRIMVEDRGTCEFESLEKMSAAFVKGASSKGMGLGLNMTRTIVREWGSDLEFKSLPTTFSFSLGQSESGSNRWLRF